MVRALSVLTTIERPCGDVVVLEVIGQMTVEGGHTACPTMCATVWTPGIEASSSISTLPTRATRPVLRPSFAASP